MSRPTREEIAAVVASARDNGSVPGYGHARFFRPIVALADDLAEARALLEEVRVVTSDYCEGCEGDDEPISDECQWDDATPCLVHRMVAFLARTR